jgi:transposase InsO family protein
VALLRLSAGDGRAARRRHARQPQEGHAPDAGARSNGASAQAFCRHHDDPIFPNLAKDVAPTGPNQLWVADITYITIATGFVYLAAVLDAWSRRVVGYAISRRVDARLALAALRAAIVSRQPPKGCIHHSDRGSQYAAEDYRAELEVLGLKGSMGRRGNPYDNAKAELHEDAQGRGGLRYGLRDLR